MPGGLLKHSMPTRSLCATPPISKLPHPQVSKEFPGKVETSTPYVIGKVVSRFEMDTRCALARSVRALVAERDGLKQKLDSIEQLDSANG